MDAPVRMLVGARALVAGPWEKWGIGWGDGRPISGILLGLACLALFAIVGRSLVRRRQDRDWPRPSRATAWMLGTTLVVCGFSQLAQAVGSTPRVPLAVESLVAAAACWAAALAVRPVARDVAPIEAVPAHPPVPEVLEHRRLEEDLRQTREELHQLAEADTRKNEFLAVLGHELRNPLAPIRNALRIMKRRRADDPDWCWARDVVEHQLQHLGQLIDDLQEVSRVISGKVRLQTEPVDVATIVAFAVETSRPVIEAHHHHLTMAQPSGPLWVEADPIRMSQVLSNLLNNAAKYTEAGGRIRLTVAGEGADVVFRVRDNGMGIPPAMLSRIFDRFSQVDHALVRSEGGLGLGLTLARSLTEMHGGSVEARSDGPGRGSEFLVRLPALPTAPARTKGPAPPGPRAWEIPPAETPPSNRGSAQHPVPAMTGLALEPETRPVPARRVLVVDDNTSAAQSLAMILKHEGYDVQVAYDGEAALKAARSFRPGAILMDIGLPGIDGYEVARRLRQDPELESSVGLLAAITGYADAESQQCSRAAGFDHHLAKPVDPDSILDLLSAAIGPESLSHG